MKAKFILLIKRLLPMFLYMVIYMIWFTILEKTVVSDYHIIHRPLDDYIPFIKEFIIPYDLWFLYVALTLVYLALADYTEYKNTCFFICLGMTLFLIVSTVYPNGHDLRPGDISGTDFCSKLVRALHSTDTPTNIFPSIHVFNSLGMCIGLLRTKTLKKFGIVKIASTLLCILIILATMFLKQHSVFDVYTAFGCALVFYFVVYHGRFLRSAKHPLA